MVFCFFVKIEILFFCKKEITQTTNKAIKNEYSTYFKEKPISD